MQFGTAESRGDPREEFDDGFTLIEVTVAAILVVVFSLAVASSLSTAMGASRINLVRQQATAILTEELEYARALVWPEAAMTFVSTAAPLLNSTSDSLDGTEVGFDGFEVLAVLPDTGIVTPLRTYSVDRQDYTVWRYVTHSTGGLRRFVVSVNWADEKGTSSEMLGSTFISEITARTNSGGVTTTTTTTTVAPTTTTTVAPTTTTTVAPTTTTTVPADPPMAISAITVAIDYGNAKQTARVDVIDDQGANLNGATVFGTWSVDPTEAGYPFDVDTTTEGPGRATFIHNDDHPVGATVQLCVTDVYAAGYTYGDGVQCASGAWS